MPKCRHAHVPFHNNLGPELILTHFGTRGDGLTTHIAMLSAQSKEEIATRILPCTGTPDWVMPLSIAVSDFFRHPRYKSSRKFYHAKEPKRWLLSNEPMEKRPTPSSTNC